MVEGDFVLVCRAAAGLVSTAASDTRCVAAADLRELSKKWRTHATPPDVGWGCAQAPSIELLEAATAHVGTPPSRGCF